METGQKIEWKIENTNFKGIFKKEIDNNLSEVRCTEKNGFGYILTVQVLTKILKIDNGK
jgi:hypothetical protein